MRRYRTLYSFSSLPMKRFALTTLSGVTAWEACIVGSVLMCYPNNASLHVQEPSSDHLRSCLITSDLEG